MDPAKDIAVTAAVTGVAAVWATAKGVALELLGVPLPVVLAAATAAFAARSFLPATTYPKAVVSGMAWTLIAVFLSNFALTLANWWLEKEMPVAALGGIALLIAGLGQLLWPVVRDRLPGILGKQLDRFGGSNDRSS